MNHPQFHRCPSFDIGWTWGTFVCNNCLSPAWGDFITKGLHVSRTLGTHPLIIIYKKTNSATWQKHKPFFIVWNGSNEWGEPTATYEMDWLSLRNNWLRFTTSSFFSQTLERNLWNRPPINKEKDQNITMCNWLDLQTLGSWLSIPKKFLMVKCDQHTAQGLTFMPVLGYGCYF